MSRHHASSASMRRQCPPTCRRFICPSLSLWLCRSPLLLVLARPLCSCQGAQLATQSSTLRLPSRGAKGDRRRHRSQRFLKGAELHREIPMRPWVSAIVSETRGGAPPSSSRPRRTPHSSTGAGAPAKSRIWSAQRFTHHLEKRAS